MKLHNLALLLLLTGAPTLVPQASQAVIECPDSSVTVTTAVDIYRGGTKIPANTSLRAYRDCDVDDQEAYIVTYNGRTVRVYDHELQ